MTIRERFLAFAGFQPVDRVPRYADFVQGLRDTMTAYLGQDPDRAFAMDRPQSLVLRPPAGYVKPDYRRYHAEYRDRGDEFTIDDNGCGHLNHGFHHFTEYIGPLRNATRFEELEAYPFIDRTQFVDDDLAAVAAAAHARGQYTRMWVGHMYENAWQVRGYEPFLIDLLTQRDWAEYILDRYYRNNLVAAQAAARAGCDCLAVGDDIANQNAMMFEPQLWREVMKPRWAAVFAAARAIKPDIHIWYHSDGNIWDVLDDLVEIGVTILNPVQPECLDVTAIRRRFGRRLAFDGCVGTQTTFPFGSAADMHQRIAELGAGLDALCGGLSLSPTHVLEPEVPPENVVAFFEACDKLH